MLFNARFRREDPSKVADEIWSEGLSNQYEFLIGRGIIGERDARKHLERRAEVRVHFESLASATVSEMSEANALVRAKGEAVAVFQVRRVDPSNAEPQNADGWNRHRGRG